MRVLVCGARDWADAKTMFDCLHRVAAVLRVDVIIEGEAPGADLMARRWAEARGIPVEAYPADWKRYGRAAGPNRNRKMLLEGRPDLVIAFPTPASRGTWDMVRVAREARVKVLVMPGEIAEIDALGEGVFA